MKALRGPCHLPIGPRDPCAFPDERWWRALVSHAGLMGLLPTWGGVDVSDRPDRHNSVSSAVIRCSYQGRRTVAVGGDASTEVCVGAVLDVLDMYLHEGPTYAGGSVTADEVAIILGERRDTEGLDAIGSLLAAQRGGPAVRVLLASGSGAPVDLAVEAADFSTSPKAQHYLKLMRDLESGPPALLRNVQERVGREELRAYPMLTGNPWWSLRLEGLEVGRFRPGHGWLDVGKPGKTGLEGEARRKWRTAVGDAPLADLRDDPNSIRTAARGLNDFAQAWLAPSGQGAAVVRQQNEHALESRILRGTCTVRVDTGPLQLLQPDSVTNWGSQFPTRWGHTTGKAARYLDALMREGRVPWAVEMKVRGSGGVGGYYRHAVGQAVLYRHFIRSAAPLDDWFDSHALDRTSCQAAVVVPDLDLQPAWRERLRAVCELFEVELVEVAHRYASLG